VYVELELVPEPMRSTRPVSCAVCGTSFVVGVVLANAYSNDGRLNFGPVCPRCLAGGPEEMAEQLEAQAEWTRWEADAVHAVFWVLQCITSRLPASEFPRRPLLGSPVNRGNPPLSRCKQLLLVLAPHGSADLLWLSPCSE
jgi:hypothetical protein